MENMFQDLIYSLRMLLKSRVSTVIAIVSLALGIGANATIFSVVNALLVRPLPFTSPDQLVMVGEVLRGQADDLGSTSYIDYQDLRAASQSFDGLEAYYEREFSLLGDAEAERVSGASISYNLFSMLGINPVAGRQILAEEDRPGAPLTCLISADLWKRRFNADQSLIGKPITLNTKTYTLVGVMPAGFHFPFKSDVWVPLFDYSSTSRETRYLQVIGRLKPGISKMQASTELNGIAARLEQQFPETNTGIGITVTAIRDVLYGKELRLGFSVLLGAVGFVLLIACANIANLLLVRTGARAQELAIRLALGATRGRIVRQLLTESLLLGVVGGTLGIFLALWGVELLVQAVPEELPYFVHFTIDQTVLGFVVLVSVATSLLFGIVPALRYSVPDLHTTLKESAKNNTSSVHRNRIGSFLVVAEVALALVLLIGASLMIESFLRLTRVHPGFTSQHIVTFRTTGHGEQFHQEVLGKLATLPGVESVGAVLGLPLEDSNSTAPLIDPVTGREYEIFQMNPLGNYFSTMQIPLLAGRFFSEQDTRDALKVVILNQSLARRLFPNGDAIGKVVKQGKDPDDPALTVIGIVGDVKRGALNDGVESQMYLPYTQINWDPSLTFVVRTRTAAEQLLPAIRQTVADIDLTRPVYGLQTMTDVIRRSRTFWMSRLLSTLFGFFASVALFLAAIGIYGVISYSVSQRTREMGIRMALGAQHRDIVALIVGQAMRLTLIGLGIGLGIAFGFSRFLSSLLFEISPTSPMTIGSVVVVLGLVALSACYLPVQRAIQIDPMRTLRNE